MKPMIARPLLALLLSLLLASCGVGGIATIIAGVGTGGTGVTWGIVTGFGSILVDGDIYSSASGEYYEGNDNDEDAPVSAFSVDLGEYLMIQRDDQGKPTSILIEPALIGVAHAVDGANGTLEVNGVRVKVNTNWTAGPVTYYAGITGLDDVTAGHTRLEIHGHYGVDGGGGYIQATRIKLDTSTATRITGVVTDLGAGFFKIGGVTISYGAATVLPSVDDLAQGRLVNVWSSSAMSGGNLTANVIRVRTLRGATGTAAIAGLVTSLGGNRFNLSGIQVDASGISGLSLANGQYIVVIGTVANTTHDLVAASIRTTPTQASEVELKGTVTAYDSANKTLVVRGVPIVYDSNTEIDGGLGLGKYVEVHGKVAGSVVLAEEINVEDSAPDGGSVEYSGTVSGFNGTSFVLTTESASYNVTLADNVGYENGSAEDLHEAGRRIEIEASQTAYGLVAYAIEFE